MVAKDRIWIEPGFAEPGDVVIDSRAGRLLVEREPRTIPPLPTEPYTVIEVVWAPNSHQYPATRLMRMPEDAYMEWSFSCNDGDEYGNTDDLRKKILGFKVLARPVQNGLVEG